MFIYHVMREALPKRIGSDNDVQFFGATKEISRFHWIRSNASERIVIIWQPSTQHRNIFTILLRQKRLISLVMFYCVSLQNYLLFIFKAIFFHKRLKFFCENKTIWIQ